MLRLFGTFAVVFALVAMSNGQFESDRERANVLGAVKTVKERSYHYMGLVDYKKDDKGSSRFDTGDTVTYDLRGREIERIMVSDFGEFMGKQTQRFDGAGPVQETVFTNAKGAVEEKSRYSYADGKLTQIMRYDGKGVLFEKTIRTYEGSGKLIAEAYFDPAVARAKTIFKYDASGNAIEMAFFLSNGQKAYAPIGPCLGAHRVTYTYDDKKRPITKAVFETDGKVKKSWTYSYDTMGNQLTGTMKSGGTTTTYDFKYEYDASGNWIRSVSTSDSDDHLLELMLKAPGKTATPEELKAMNARTKITRVIIREITYH